MVRRKRLRVISKRKVPVWLRDKIGSYIREEYQAGRPLKQAVAIGYSRVRREHPEFAGALARREGLVS